MYFRLALRTKQYDRDEEEERDEEIEQRPDRRSEVERCDGIEEDRGEDREPEQYVPIAFVRLLGGRKAREKDHPIHELIIRVGKQRDRKDRERGSDHRHDDGEQLEPMVGKPIFHGP